MSWSPPAFGASSIRGSRAILQIRSATGRGCRARARAAATVGDIANIRIMLDAAEALDAHERC